MVEVPDSLLSKNDGQKTLVHFAKKGRVVASYKKKRKEIKPLQVAGLREAPNCTLPPGSISFEKLNQRRHHSSAYVAAPEISTAPGPPPLLSADNFPQLCRESLPTEGAMTSKSSRVPDLCGKDLKPSSEWPQRPELCFSQPIAEAMEAPQRGWERKA